MTPSEAAHVRDVIARNRELERENARLRALLKTTRTMRRKVADEGRLLHGLLVANGVEVPR